MEWAILFTAAGDLMAAVLFGLLDLKSVFESATITLFEYVGIRLAHWISELIPVR